ncbi:fasciclin domain-containing protein [Nocardioides bruguierae]|uniref:Fasciclin domain-containing protein n=1 Tax=Nocardioides bruguierae TaxID=2945102 RepID=A0A9X2D6Z7_9ACTN|nr:fasciclin domain-containing protein [Nocardioides bruguierae]MCL8024064.1 fasciclin domain-containing protein [Nocardioides bruguierae]MCM0620270.1 fasciclin domain-containing protein [Nocardioides bruguierae]
MKRTTLRLSGGLAVAVLTMGGLAACGSESTDNAASDTETSASATESESMDSMESEDTTTEASAGDQVFGPACSAVPTDGAGSFDGMVSDPVATAASNNPLLGTLVSAVQAADLVDTLNGADALTVFAPTDDAFAEIPKKTLNAVLKDKDTLTAILTHHVVAGQMDPDQIVGDQETLNGDMVTVEGDTDGMTVDGANVLCGNIPTANATVYVIDQVLMP